MNTALSFRFPSNGKAYINFKDHATGLYPFATVSIPFKRESIYQLQRSCDQVFILSLLFRFPSNGKAYINQKKVLFGHLKSRFRFPSNGKAYININRWLRTCLIIMHVSIPFKRESIYQHLKSRQAIAFLSVSIPFKRESIYQLFEKYEQELEGEKKFQFPSNGKAYINQNAQQGLIPVLNSVSIPFKRESIYQRDGGRITDSFSGCGFNSLQTGKHISTLCVEYQKLLRIQDVVSIPFKRESIYQHRKKRRVTELGQIVSIPFKRESIYQRQLDASAYARFFLFQFPSNGKAYINTT